ncbi:hypothetical protein I305_03625 [Cryptococcus gattii E566]|nr:hypothetical protein I305_03625 [Cryptococcus gattii E566]KJE01792.1 hypothetical protein I311_04569 [Cryptococcus gattii NT-10]
MKQRMIKNQPLSVRTFFFANSRINPTDHDQSLDDRASRKRLAHIATVNLIGQGCKGRNTNKEEDKCNGHGDKMRDKPKSIALTKELETESPCSCPYTRHQQNPYPVPVRIGVDRRVTVAVVVTDKGSGYAKRYNRGKENKREEEGMRESNNTFRRHCGWL